MFSIIDTKEQKILEQAKSVSAAWDKLRLLRDNGTLVTGMCISVLDENGMNHINIVMRTNKDGKLEFHNQTKEIKKMAEKRIRRSLTQIVLDKVDEKGKGLDQRSYLAIRKRIESALNDLEELIKKENSTKLTKGKISRLSKFTKEELEEYLKTL
jgi:hypothetical protein